MCNEGDDTMERLELKIDNFKEMLIEHSKRNDEQFSAMKELFQVKLDSTTCDNCSIAPKLKEAEAKIDDLNVWRHINTGAIIILAGLIPYILPKIFS